MEGSVQRKPWSLGAIQCKDKEVPQRRTTLNHQKGLNEELHDWLTEGGGKRLMYRWTKIFSNGCAHKLWEPCELCKTLRTKTLRWHQSLWKRRTSQMPNFRSSQVGTNAGLYLWRHGWSAFGRLLAHFTINTSTWRKEASSRLMQEWHHACLPLTTVLQGTQSGEVTQVSL